MSPDDPLVTATQAQARLHLDGIEVVNLCLAVGRPPDLDASRRRDRPAGWVMAVAGDPDRATVDAWVLSTAGRLHRAQAPIKAGREHDREAQVRALRRKGRFWVHELDPADLAGSLRAGQDVISRFATELRAAPGTT